MPADWMAARFGTHAAHLLALAHGRDDRRVVPDAAAKSIGHEQTFAQDLGSPALVRAALLQQVEHVAARLRRQGLLARRVSLKIRFGDFQTISRSRTLAGATCSTDELLRAGCSLFDGWAEKSFSPVRLIGVAAGELAPPAAQLDLFRDPMEVRDRKIDAAVDAINAKFGRRAIHRGGS
jgi:DNA polymerase-4